MTDFDLQKGSGKMPSSMFDKVEFEHYEAYSQDDEYVGQRKDFMALLGAYKELQAKDAAMEQRYGLHDSAGHPTF
jgi:hypothetical protein